MAKHLDDSRIYFLKECPSRQLLLVDATQHLQTLSWDSYTIRAYVGQEFLYLASLNYPHTHSRLDKQHKWLIIIEKKSKNHIANLKSSSKFSLSFYFNRKTRQKFFNCTSPLIWSFRTARLLSKSINRIPAFKQLLSAFVGISMRIQLGCNKENYCTGKKFVYTKLVSHS